MTMPCILETQSEIRVYCKEEQVKEIIKYIKNKNKYYFFYNKQEMEDFILLLDEDHESYFLTDLTNVFKN